jgi:biotin carboxyl carrier protein
MKMRVTIENQSYEVEVGDINTRPILATVNGETFEVLPEEVAATITSSVSAPMAVAAPVAIAPKAPVSAAATGGKAITAPIPGVIDTIKVHEGEEVKSGQELIILEAMKMKNAIRAQRSGKIARIHVTVGQQVPQSHVLLEFAD